MKRKSCGILALAAISTISLPITTVNGAKLSSSKIRGANTIDTTLHNNNSSGKKRRTRHDITNKRLPIQDSHQREKILKWNLLQQQQQLLEVESLDKVGRVQDDISESPLDHNDEEERKLSTSIHHKKTSDYGYVSVEHAKPPSQPETAPSGSSNLNLNNIIANSMNNGDKSPQAAPVDGKGGSPAVVIDGGRDDDAPQAAPVDGKGSPAVVLMW